MHVGDRDAIEPIKQLAGSGAAVDAARLADPSVPLGELGAGQSPVG
jgi:hypothetical protein